MSRFADPTKTDVFTLPDGCQCPGTPHDSDWIRFRVEASNDDMLAIARHDGPSGVVAILGIEWNLLAPDGKPAPLTPEWTSRLFPDGFDKPFNSWINEHVSVSSLGKTIADGSSISTSAKVRRIRQPRRRPESTK